MNTALCRIKEAYHSTSLKLKALEEYEEKDLYIKMAINAYDKSYDFGVVKAYNENLVNFLLSFLRASFSDPLHMLLFLLYEELINPVYPPAFSTSSYENYKEELKKHYSRKFQKKLLCDLQKNGSPLLVFGLEVYFQTTYLLGAQIGREDLVLLCKDFLINKQLIMDKIKDIREMHAVKKINTKINFNNIAEFDILDYLESFLVEHTQESHAFLFFDVYLKLVFNASKCELQDSKTIKIIFEGILEFPKENIRNILGGEKRESKLSGLPFDTLKFASYCLKKVMGEIKGKPEFIDYYNKYRDKKTRENLEKDMYQAVKEKLSYILNLLIFEFFVLYVLSVGLGKFINESVFGETKYVLEINKDKKFPLTVFGKHKSFTTTEINEDKNIAARIFFHLFEKVNFGLNMTSIKGKKTELFIGNGEFRLSYFYGHQKNIIFMLRFYHNPYNEGFNAGFNDVYFNGYMTLVYPQDRKLLSEDEDFKEDLNSLLKYFNIDKKMMDFISKVIKSKVF